jgi:hypothetical protein
LLLLMLLLSLLLLVLLLMLLLLQCISGDTGEVTTLVEPRADKAPGLLRHPIGVAVHAVRNAVIVGDSFHHCIRVVDKVTRVGSTLAGCAGEEGFRDGTAARARFFHPYV